MKTLHGALRSIFRLADAQRLRGMSDRELLRRLVKKNDETAFRVIAQRHGPMVMGVCSRTLECPHDAEDAFQATFVVLAQRAASIRKSNSLASWLYGVARRIVTRRQAGPRCCVGQGDFSRQQNDERNGHEQDKTDLYWFGLFADRDCRYRHRANNRR